MSGSPQVGRKLTARLVDPDLPTSVSWQWKSAEMESGTYADIADATSRSYTPTEADEGKWLQVVASYTDEFGSGKTAVWTAGAATAAALAVCSAASGNELTQVGRQGPIWWQVHGPQMWYKSWWYYTSGDELAWKRPPGRLYSVDCYIVEERVRTADDDSYGDWSVLAEVADSNPPGNWRWHRVGAPAACTNRQLSVRAQFSNGDVGPRSWVTQYRLPTSRPGAPGVDALGDGYIQQNGTTYEVDVDWNAISCALEYEVQYSTREGSATNPTWSSWTTVTDHDGETDYQRDHNFDHDGDGIRIRVRARNNIGWGSWSRSATWVRGISLGYWHTIIRHS